MCKDGIEMPHNVLSLAAAQGWVYAFNHLRGDRKTAIAAAIAADQVNILRTSKVVPSMYFEAARYGALKCFKYIHSVLGVIPSETDDYTDPSLMAISIANGQFEMLKYLGEILDKSDWRTGLLEIAANEDQYDIFVWLDNNGCDAGTISSTDVKILTRAEKYLDKGFTIQQAIAKNRIDVVSWMFERKHIDNLGFVVMLAIVHGRTPILELAITYGAVITEDNLYLSILCGHIKVYELLRSIIPISTFKCFTMALFAPLRMLRYLRQFMSSHELSIFMSDALEYAAAINDVKRMRVFRKWGAKSFSTPTVHVRKLIDEAARIHPYKKWTTATKYTVRVRMLLAAWM